MIKMFKLFVSGFIFITILQILVVFPGAYGEENKDDSLAEDEFYLLCKEVLMELISYQDGELILKGDEKLKSKKLDMSISWWTSSKIWGKWEIYKDRYEDLHKIFVGEYEPPKPKSVEAPFLPSVEPVVIPYEEETKGFVTLKAPKLISNPSTKMEEAILTYRRGKLFHVSRWSYQRRMKPWWYYATAAAAGMAVYVLHEKYEPTDIVKLRKVMCWTACASGEPEWKKPSLPSETMSLEEYKSQPDLQGWYAMAMTKEEQSGWYAGGRNFCIVISVVPTAVALWRLVHPEKIFPKQK